jgi:hypothetical protein
VDAQIGADRFEQHPVSISIVVRPCAQGQQALRVAIAGGSHQHTKIRQGVGASYSKIGKTVFPFQSHASTLARAPAVTKP